MEKILGLDLGTNSIGWAIRETNPELDNQIIDKGVLTFDKGVAEDKSGEHPMVQKRTESRGKRRNYQSEKYRKWTLLETLIDNGMCPLTIDELNDWRHYKKGVGRKYPKSKAFINWLRFDFDGDGKPDFERLGYSKHESYYLFRALIIDPNKKDIFHKEPHIIGRVFYQLVQRRGFNDIGDIEEDEKNELSKTILKGGGDSGALGANEIEPYIKEYKTLGAALYFMQKEKGKSSRIRKRYNLRSRYEAEIKEICKIQNLNDIYKKIWQSIVWQRPLRSQKGLVGLCTFEKNKNRIAISHPLYEEYRTWVFINNLKIRPIENRNYDKAEIAKIANEIVYPEFYKTGSDFKLSSIQTKLNKAGYEIGAKFPDDTKVLSVYFLNQIEKIFGEILGESTEWFDILNKKEKNIIKYSIEDLWHIHFVKTTNKDTGETGKDFIKRFAIEKLKLDEKRATLFSEIKIKQGYATLSKNAILKILPYLKKGFIYSEAIYLANLPKVLGVEKIDENIIEHFSTEIRNIISNNQKNKYYLQATNELISVQLNSNTRYGMDKNYQLDQDDFNDIENKLIEVFGLKTWNNMTEDEKNEAKKTVSERYLNFLRKNIYSKNVFEKTERLHDQIFNWLKETYQIDDDRIKYLWHPSEQETYKQAEIINNHKLLGSPEPISKGFKNPMALKTLHRLKQLINYLIKKGKIDEDTRIVIEIARELNDANMRKAIQKYQRENEIENQKYKDLIIEINNNTKSNFNPDDKNLIDKLRLWDEQKNKCIYTGKTIQLTEVLDGSKFDFEHTIPASMSFDNEMKNLTLADKTYNQQIKGKKLPSECPNYDTDITLNGITYPSILRTLEVIFGELIEVTHKGKNKKPEKRWQFSKIIELENKLAIERNKTSDDKQIKDNIIVNRHLAKMRLDYWRNKLNAFLIKEYKAGFRNSQLRDTQIITKYALPYMKTVFKKVEVQKGSITSTFRKIYKINDAENPKTRERHTHHAIDAAVLTLIPPASKRETILKKYNEAIDNNQKTYHELPYNWKDFKTNYVLSINNETLINYMPDNRHLVKTYKNVRKRGRLQFVKEKTSDGKWQYKKDEQGNKIPLIAKGDSIRGQLHKDSYFGAIQKEGDIILVERYPISSFTSIKDCNNIVDNTVRELVRHTLNERMKNGLSFDKAKLEPIPFHKGNEIIKKVRCKVAAGRGYLGTDKAIKINKHDFESKHDYKNYVYAQNDTNAYCLYYELTTDEQTYRAFRNISMFELAQLKIKNPQQFKKDPYYNTIISGKGKKQIEIPLKAILQNGTKCIFFEKSKEELKNLTKTELMNRIFKVYKFNNMSDLRLIYLQNHVEARKNELIGDGETNFDSQKYQGRLKLNPNKFNCCIEGFDFKINIDGTINWLF